MYFGKYFTINPVIIKLKIFKRKNMSYIESELAKTRYTPKPHHPASALRIKMKVKNRRKRERVLK